MEYNIQTPVGLMMEPKPIDLRVGDLKLYVLEDGNKDAWFYLGSASLRDKTLHHACA